MGNIDNPSIWEKIQRNVQETERLMGQKKYNLSMIKARQTLEYMVKLQCDKAGIVEGPLETMIKELYSGKFVSKSTAEHYLQILALGNKAAKEGDNSAYNANQAFHVLSQEIYSFSNEGREKTPRRRAAPSGDRSSKSRKKQAPSGLNGADLLKLLIPVVLIIVLIFLIRVLAPKKTPTDETTPVPTTVEQTIESSAEPTTAAPETAAPAVTYRTTTTLNVRKGPSTNDDRIGKLDPNVTVEYVRDHDAQWAVIMYNGQEAYVAKEYLAEVQP